MTDFETVIAFISSCAAIISALFAGIQLSRTRKTQEEMLIREKKKDTIEAFNKLQTQVFDKLNEYSKQEIEEIASGSDWKKYAEIKKLIAKCEHFAVGVEEETYDFHMVERLSGNYIYYAYEKVYLIIKKTREGKGKPNKNYYNDFEKLHDRLAPPNRQK